MAQHHLQEMLIGQPGGQEEHRDDLRPFSTPLVPLLEQKTPEEPRLELLQLLLP